MPKKFVPTPEMILELQSMVDEGIYSKQDLFRHFKIGENTLNTIAKDYNIENFDTPILNTCKICGKQYRSAKRSDICNDNHITTCVICGKEFNFGRNWPIPNTCSPECRGKWRKQTGLSKQIAERSQQTKLERYGTLDGSKISKPTELKKCKECGKLFLPDTYRQEYCKEDHYRPCPVCGKPVLVLDFASINVTCSKECRQKLISQTNQTRYGVDCVFESEEMKSKIKNTNLEKYGVEHASQSVAIQEKIQQTMIAKYGVPYAMQLEAFKAKAKATCVDKYGVSSYNQSAEGRDKLSKAIRQSRLDDPSITERTQATNFEKYGGPSPMCSLDVQAKAQATCQERYGTKYYGQSFARTMRTISDPSKAKNWSEFKADPARFILEHYDHKPSVIHELMSDLGVTDTPIYNVLVNNDCRDLAMYKRSDFQEVIKNALFSINSELNIVENCRSVIPKLEIDLYLPDYHLGIECNPTATHNSSLPDPWGGGPKPSSYHYKKSVLAAKQGIFVFHIFGYDWTQKRDIILSMLRNLLGMTTRRIYARNTYVDIISDAECKQFLQLNHQKGSGSFKYRYGLRCKNNDELVSVMTFNKMRSTIGVNEAGTFELSRFCNLVDTAVVGGASKLFKHFLQDVPEASNIVSYSDLAHTRGDLYTTLGFVEEAHSSANYVWVDVVNDTPVNRVNCQKRNIQKFLHDDSIDLTKTERQIMIEHGYVQVFDSGTIRWRYTR